MTAKPTGFTILQDPPDPELDIVFVHGLQGHPRNTWTFVGKQRVEGTPEKRRFVEVLLCRSKIGSQLIEVFWPQDLLKAHQDCSRARILTYGYDSVIFGTPNLSTIMDQGLSLLNGLARVRAEDSSRPLMLIVHSLGGLVVKAALNTAFRKDDERDADLRAVVDSAFAILFFGTPHRGSRYANLAAIGAKGTGLLTMRPHNDKILTNLRPNTEILTELRESFDATHNYLIKRNRFESSTFQEAKGLSGKLGLRAKVVENDSSEFGRNDRREHINRNHMEMCRFESTDDPEYEKVAGEIRRHIRRLRASLAGLVKDEGEDKSKMAVQFENSATANSDTHFFAGLQSLGQAAEARSLDIEKKSEGTLEWLYSAKARSDGDAAVSKHQPFTLTSWLSIDHGLFWITGRPGSGKSTAMKWILENHQTRRCLPGSMGRDQSMRLQRQEAGQQPRWLIINLFVTNRGSEHQRQWHPMLYGLLYQLVRDTPSLIPQVAPLFLHKSDPSSDSSSPSGDTGAEEYVWTPAAAEQALKDCKSQTIHPLHVLILFDGLDELESEEDARRAVAVIEHLTEPSRDMSHNKFKACIASRKETVFLDLLGHVPRIEVHEHTKGDIRRHVWQRLRSNSRFRLLKDREVEKELGKILDYIGENAEGVFLWAHSVSALIDSALSDRESMDRVFNILKELPTEMQELYTLMMGRIKPRLRQRAYIMLETVLRARSPLTLTQLSLVVDAAQSNLAGNPRPWKKGLPHHMNTPDPQLLYEQLTSNCKCFLEVVRPYTILHTSSALSDTHYVPSDSGNSESDLSPVAHRTTHDQKSQRSFRVNTDTDDDRPIDLKAARVQLLHRSAKDFLLLNNPLQTLLADDGSGTGNMTSNEMLRSLNGHIFILQVARAWMNVPRRARNKLDVHMDFAEEVVYHAPRAEKALGSSIATNPAKYLFPLLDDLDGLITRMDNKYETWPGRCLMGRTGDSGIGSWRVTFAAFAVAAGMCHYVRHLIAKADQNNDRDNFLNGKLGRPLLHFSVYTTSFQPKPEMTRLILESGADVNAKFEGKTAIESLVISFERWPSEHFAIYKLLLEHGANANSRHYPDWREKSTWVPLLHLVLSSNSHDIPTPAIDFMKLLFQFGADLNGKDSNGTTFPEALLDTGKRLLSNEVYWLMKQGAKVTSMMASDIQEQGIVSAKTNVHAILYQPAFRRKEWYCEDAAELADRLHPGWFQEG